MVDGMYDIAVDTPIGKKAGTVTLRSSGSALDCTVEAKGIGKLSGTGNVNGDEFSIEGAARIFLLGKIGYRIKGRVDGNVLSAVCDTDKGSLKITGSRR